MAITALAGVVVGALLGLLSALVIEARRDQRDARAAARIIQTELIEITLVASSLSPTTAYPFPIKDSAWRSHGDRLAVGRFSFDDWVSLSSFYVMNSLVETGGTPAPTCEEVEKQALEAANLLGRFAGVSFWKRIRSRVGRVVKSALEA
jgi:hypothetical protein